MYTLKKEISKYYLHYLLLLVLEAIGVFSVYYFSYDTSLQFASIVYMSAVYIGWGFVHHLIAKDFHLKILVEYVLFAAISSLLLWVLIFKP